MQLGEREREREERVAAGAAEKGGREIEEVVLWLCVCGGGGGWRQAEEQCWGQRPLARGNEWKATFKFVCAVQWR